MYVELPEVGSEVKQKEQFGVVESVKVGCRYLRITLILNVSSLQHRLRRSIEWSEHGRRAHDSDANAIRSGGSQHMDINGSIYLPPVSCRPPATCTPRSAARSQRSTQRSWTTRPRCVAHLHSLDCCLNELDMQLDVAGLGHLCDPSAHA